MSLSHIAKGTLRVAKNYTKGYSDVQAKVREATSNDPWGPSGQQMNDIAQMTYNQNDFVEIMEMIDKRLNDKGKNWRHVFKALTLLDYLIHAGSDNVVIYFKDNLYLIKTLKEFQYIDEYEKDQGANVRQKAKDISNLLMDDARLREARKNRASMRDRMLRGNGFEGDGDDEDGESSRRYQPPRSAPPAARRGRGDDDELQRAIEASKKSFQTESGGMTAEERDIAAALKLSEEEEEKRKREAQSGSLFDADNNQQQQQVQGTNPFPLINFEQQPQQLQYMQPQFTAYNPYQAQAQAEQEAMQAEWLRQQQLAQQQAEYQAQAQAQAQYQAQLQQQQQQQEEWMRMQLLQQQQEQQQALYNQQLAQQQELLRQQQVQQQQNAFGNNPWGQTQSPPPQPPQPQIQAPVQQQPSPAPVPKVKTNDGNNAHLAALFANRDDGQDTFGNTGVLRYGHGAGQRLIGQPTGNPFARQPGQQQQTNDQPFFSI